MQGVYFGTYIGPGGVATELQIIPESESDVLLLDRITYVDDVQVTDEETERIQYLMQKAHQNKINNDQAH